MFLVGLTCKKRKFAQPSGVKKHILPDVFLSPKVWLNEVVPFGGRFSLNEQMNEHTNDQRNDEFNGSSSLKFQSFRCESIHRKGFVAKASGLFRAIPGINAGRFVDGKITINNQTLFHKIFKCDRRPIFRPDIWKLSL